MKPDLEPADIPGTGDRVTTPGAPLSQQISEFALWLGESPDAAQEWAQTELTEWILELRNRWAHELMALTPLDFGKAVHEEMKPLLDGAGGPSWQQVRERMMEHTLGISQSKLGWTVMCLCGKDLKGELADWEKHQRARVKELFHG